MTRPYPALLDRPVERPGRVVIDLVLPSRYVDWSLSDQLTRLEPFGPGHVEPVLAITGMQLVEARRVGAKEQHLAFRLRRGIEAFDAVAFNVEPDRAVPEAGSWIDLVGTLERDDFGGFPRLRLRVVDFADADSSPLVARRALARPTLARAG
jgi:single-stranded-DNA-specific exonuclease